MNLLDLDIANADLVVPGFIAALCLLAMVVTWFVTRAKPTADDVHVADTAAPEPVQVEAEELRAWHQRHGAVVQQWIEQHEAVLKHVSDQGLQLDLLGAELTDGHDRLARAMRDAITTHPAPPMRAQLSALVVSGEATLHALKRSEYQNAERQHITYLQYRDSWLARLRQFSSADTTIRQLQAIPQDTPATDQFRAG